MKNGMMTEIGSWTQVIILKGFLKLKVLEISLAAQICHHN